MNCQYCNKVCKNKNSFTNHERLCPSNPNRKYKNGMQGKTPWNKGLSKEADERVAAHADTLKGRPSTVVWTEEMRQSQSKMVKERHIKFPETHVNRRLAGNRSKMTYPEQVAHDWFVKNDFMFSHNKKVGKYFPDFLIDNIIVEIDGEHWHPVGNEKDAIRDAELTAMGYTVYRIRSSERIEERLSNIFGV